MKSALIAGTALVAVLAAAFAPARPVSAQTAAVSASAGARPWMDRKLSAARRADLLLAQMTLDEKIAMLHGPMTMLFGPGAKLPDGAIGSAGFIPGNARLGIPALNESDASLGVTNPGFVRGQQDMSTALPSSLALAASFDPALAKSGGAMIGNEARAKGINVQLAGGVNLLRDPRGGRNFEYAGEDPLLAGMIGGAAIAGIQSTGIVSTVKHFSLNDQEHLRMTANSVIGEANHRESDLLAFEIAIEQGNPGSVMCSYNMINGSYGCENDHLLNKTLKQDWGYKGWVMSDWGAVHSLDALPHGLDQQSGEQLDKQVWFDKPLKEAVASGKIPEARVTDAARRILHAMFEHGLFDNPPVKGLIDFEAHAKIALAQAEGSIVLLKNGDDILPLAKTAKRIAVIGGHADAGVPSGTGSSQVNSPFRTSPFPLRSVPIGGEGLMASFASVVFHPSSPLAAIRDMVGAPKSGAVGIYPAEQAAKGSAIVTYDNGLYASSAAASAKEADVAIVFVYQPSGEGDDVPDMTLPYGQDALIEAVAAANPNTIVVLETGNAIRMPWATKVKGIIQAWYSGSKGGEAIARVLFGEVNPSGRLPLTWPMDESQLPRPVVPGWDQPEGTEVDVDYNIEGSDVGYRWYAREHKQPRYWFGYGLSYTGFSHEMLRLSVSQDVSATVSVRNTGRVAGSDVVQLYLIDKPGGAARRLLGFKKVALQPGEAATVKFDIDPRLIAEFDEKQNGWRVTAGTYRIGVGSNADDIGVQSSVRLGSRLINYAE
ncbi:glycoside hydrolase family 3 protein [Novosphingobium album (ex Hu et al. 2023)]|uniref:Glycoside hydrolase family 3 C-terminal domain-containing protein n=1 Tax=Novosphingobium album (ex Hu et al. 2023) TaxID=2930093 RepID=A0ABT0B3X7_9SPHN|nr:glycoside hydrolase family 3 C-terminal domain-containing protein [Novosphingobium album (ex Hu et al. 2023)]MCJ2179683.1 glycoside hydrolase family 3 C-terminal domain-containing protein [Novosphingobium album (ex Hu et al. 2023)]